MNQSSCRAFTNPIRVRAAGCTCLAEKNITVLGLVNDAGYLLAVRTGVRRISSSMRMRSLWKAIRSLPSS